MSELWFTSDTHFGHQRIIEFHPHRGTTVEEQDELLIDNWNATVGRKDDVWHLGDFAMGPSANIPSYFTRLRGHKHLLVGNHDHGPTKRLPWSSIDQLRELKRKPHPMMVLCHYPLLTWNRAHHGSWMLHGHCHGLLGPTSNTRMDVGVDTHPELRPYHIDEIVEVMAEREYIAVDAHR